MQMANPSAERYEATMAEELTHEAETVLERGLSWVTGSEQNSMAPSQRRETKEPIEVAVTHALDDNDVMAKLLAVLRDGRPDDVIARVHALRMSIAKQIGEDNALGVVEARFAPLLAAMEDA
jgi:hypothetical protein